MPLIMIHFFDVSFFCIAIKKATNDATSEVNGQLQDMGSLNDVEVAETKINTKEASRKKKEGKSDEDERSIAAKGQIRDFIEPSFKQLKVVYDRLKSEIETEKDDSSSTKYIDVEEMAPMLDTLDKEIVSCYTCIDMKWTEFMNILEASPDPLLQWPIAIQCKSYIDVAMKKLTIAENALQDIQKKFQTSPPAILARKMKAKAFKIGEQDGIEKYKLPIKKMAEEESFKIRRYDLGERDIEKPHKVIMMVGMTGAGKSLMINNIINYVYGVDYTDKFRFQLIVDDEEITERRGFSSKSKANSMTSWVTGFNLYHQEGFPVKFGMTIIDTPGFGDTRGIKYDEMIVNQIKSFFQSDTCCLMKEISCVGFVIQASTARITDEMKYVFDQVLNVFGKDMSDNVFILLTFADAETPPALEVLKSHDIPFGKDCVFKFNNSALFAPNTKPESEFSWKFGYTNLQKYLAHVGGTNSVSLTLTLEVLNEREHLRLILEALRPKIDQGMNILQSIENMIQTILELDGTARANKDFKVTKDVLHQDTKVVYHNITNCLPCMHTCHDPCGISGDMKRGCSSMKKGVCVVCPGKCSYETHQNGDRIYIYTPRKTQVTIEDMCNKYQISVKERDAKKILLMKLYQEYMNYKEDVFQDITTASEVSIRLEEIAMRNTYLTNVSYVERLIRSEEMSNRPNKKHRLEQLNDVLTKCKILQDAKNNPKSLTSHVSEYEETILKKICEVQDDIIDENIYRNKKKNYNPFSKGKKKGKTSYGEGLSGYATGCVANVFNEVVLKVPAEGILGIDQAYDAAMFTTPFAL